MSNKYYSQKTQEYLRKQNTMHKIENCIKTGLMLFVIVGIVALVVMDYLAVFRLSWVI